GRGGPGAVGLARARWGRHHGVDQTTAGGGGAWSSQAYRPQLRWNDAFVALIRQLVPTPTTAARHPQVERVTVVQRQFSSSLYVLPPMHRGEMLLTRGLPDAVPILRTQDIRATMLRATMAGL